MSKVKTSISKQIIARFPIFLLADWIEKFEKEKFRRVILSK